MKLLDALETAAKYRNDKEFLKIAKDGNDPLALIVKYTGTASASLTEIGTAATAEFDGGSYEQSTIKVLTAMAATPGSRYIRFDVAGTIYFAWMLKYQVVTVVCKTAANTTSGTYFTIYDSEVAPTGYYVWLDKNGDGSTDKPTVAVLTEVVCNISGATTADDVSVIVAAAINALGGFGAANTPSGTTTITFATSGDPTVAAVDVDSTYTISVTQPGGADPSGSDTGAVCDIKAATDADSVATIIQGVIDGLTDITATVATDTVTVIADEYEDVATMTTDYATSFTVTQVKAGTDSLAGTSIYISSADALDKDVLASGAVRATTIIAYYKTSGGVPSLKSEEIRQAAAGTTAVSGLEALWFRLLHLGASDWGAESNAEGAIGIKNVDKAETYIDIKIATNESESCVIWVPNHWHVLIPKVKVSFDDIAVAAAIDGCNVRMVFTGFDATKNNRLKNLVPDNDTLVFPVNLHKPVLLQRWTEIMEDPRHGTDVAKIVISESKVTTAVVFETEMVFLLWYNRNTIQD